MASRALRAFRVGSGLARAFPEPVAHAVGSGLGLAYAPLAGERRAQVVRNLRRVHGPGFGGLALRRSVAATFASYARYWTESFRLPGTPPAVLDAGMAIEGFEQVEDALAAGTGAVLALPHLGGWEWAGFWAAACRGVELTVVVEPLEPHDVYEWFVALRESFGMHVVPLGPDVGTQVLGALKANRLVCLLSDRDLTGTGVEVEFFGERTTLPAGPATLGLRTGAPVFPGAVYYGGPGHHGVVRPPLDCTRTGRLRDDVARVTQDLAHELEHLIRRAPEQWHLLQPNWPSDR
jgi:KDO2-lipid IV(A) lauroyltransferase